jgi:HAE1 family hydrophobic/amphiphilic exporter-1
VDSRFKTIEEIENFPVRDGITIKDIGRVEEIRSAPNFMFRFGGNYGTSCQITKESSANTFDVCQSLENLLNNELANDPALGRFKFRIYFNQGDMIQKSVFALINDAIIGGIIACIVLFFFLRNLPYTLLITLSIPFAVLISLSYIYFTGNTLNLMSMMGITISIGMLVDNSVVIVESIFKKREKGLSLINAICKGPSEVVLAIITATLTTIVVFLPLIFLTDNRQQQVIAEAIGMPLIIALISALVLSIIIVPVAAKIIGTKVKNKKSGQIPKFLTKPLFKILNWSLKFRFRAATLYALVLMSSSIATEGREMSITDNQQGGQINVRFSFTEGTTLIDGHEEVVNIEQTVLQTKDFQERFPEIAVGCWFTRSGGSLMVWPNRPLKDSEKTTLMEYLEKNLPQTARTKFRFSQEMQRGRTSRGKDWTRVRVQGPDHSVIQNIVQDIREAGNRSENFSEVSKERDRSNEVLVSLDRERMSQLGINSQSVIGNIEWTMRGFMVSRFETETQEIPIILEYDTPVKPDRGSLEELLVASEQSITPLSTFAEFKNSRGTTEINRLDGKISDVIGLKSIHKDPQKAAKDVGKLMSGIQMPEGYKWNISGGWSDAQNDMEDLQIALLIAIGLVFFLMGLLFNSIILPLSALTTIGFAITGANWAFKVTDHPFGAIEMVGMIVLAGVVVNNAIVLIDKILQLENSGIASSQAIIKAVEDRMRPVFMTALTTVCGLLPIAISEAAGNSVSFKGMAIGIIGGITLATFFTLTVVPLSFSIFRDFGKLCQNLFSGRKFT